LPHARSPLTGLPELTSMSARILASDSESSESRCSTSSEVAAYRRSGADIPFRPSGRFTVFCEHVWVFKMKCSQNCPFFLFLFLFLVFEWPLSSCVCRLRIKKREGKWRKGARPHRQRSSPSRVRITRTAQGVRGQPAATCCTLWGVCSRISCS
jgi:hypothetical protein